MKVLETVRGAACFAAASALSLFVAGPIAKAVATGGSETANTDQSADEFKVSWDFSSGTRDTTTTTRSTTTRNTTWSPSGNNLTSPTITNGGSLTTSPWSDRTLTTGTTAVIGVRG